MPLTHVIFEEAASPETRLLGGIFVVFILREVRELLEDLIESLALGLLHDSLVDLGGSVISNDGGVEILKGVFSTDAISLIFGVRVGEDNNVVPLVVMDLVLMGQASLTIGGCLSS